MIAGNSFADEVTIGSGASGTDYIPLEVFQNYSYTQQIYLQSEINAGGTATITEIHFYWDGGGSCMRTIVVYMAHTTKSSFSDNTDWVTSGLTEVYSGFYTLTLTEGWHKITLDNSFEYNNTDNLLIAVDDNTGYPSTTHEFFLTDQGSDRTLYCYQSTNINPSSPPNSGTAHNTMVADIKLVYTTSGGGTSYTWDASSSGGIQSGDGTWGSDNFWTNDGGSTRVAWPGSGNDAVFTGNSGSHSITVSGTQTLDSLTVKTGTYTFSGGTLDFGSNSGINIDNSITANIGSALSSSGGIKKHGGGTLVLTGPNTYTSATTVSEGTLHVTGSTASGSAVTVASGATLGGTGTVSGTVAANGAIAPGTTGYGTLTIGSSLTFAGTGSLSSTIGGKTAGTDYDQVVMSTGTLTLASASLSLTLSYEPAASDAFTLINNAGTNTVSGTFSGYSQGATVTLNYNGGSYDFTISYSSGTGNDVVLSYTGETPGTDNYSDWRYSQEIELNTTPGGANVLNDVLNFPVLIRLNPGNFDYFSQTLDDGADIRFAKTDGNHLSYEIERWVDNTNDIDTAEIWVKVDTVYGNNSTQSFLMYWGKSDAADSSDAEAVFATGTNFKAVYHLNENPGGGAGSIKDRTSNGYDGSPSGMNSDDCIAGAVGIGLDFDGSDYIDLGNVGIHNSTRYSVSLWVNGAGTQSDKRVFAEGSTSDNDPLFTLGTDNDGVTSKAEGLGRNNSGGYEITQNTCITTDDVFDGTWHHVVWVDTFNGTNNRYTWYVDGSASGTNTYSKNTKSFTNSAIGAIIRASVSNYFTGKIDEMRLVNTNRSADWIKLCYETQNPDQSTTVLKEIDNISLLPLTISHTIGDGSSDVCTVSTDSWMIIFSEADGAGIKWLSDETSGGSRGSNQLSNANNLFYIRAHDINSYSVTGQLTLLDSGSLFCHVGQTFSINSHEWRAEYTVYGSGRVFIRVETDAFSSAYDPTNGVEFRIETNVGSNGAYYAENGTASASDYILHADSGSGKFDILLALYEDWTQASGFTSTTGDFYGYVDNDWQLASGEKQSWEFMIDFAHKIWNDTAGNSIGSHVDDFRESDSLEFIVGTNGMEKDWERLLAAHWPFDDSTGTTADDIADGPLDHNGTVTNAVWDNSDYMWKGALDFEVDGGNDYVTVSSNVSSFMHGVFTVMMWLKPETAISASSVLFSKYSSSQGYKVAGDASGNLALTLDGVTISANSGPGTGSWKHIAVTNHSHSAKHTFYIDGKLAGYQLSDESITGNSANVIIGDGYDGKMDDVRFYNNEFSEGTIRAISQNNYRPDQGKYMVRADNNGTVHLKIDGSTSTPRRFPIFQIYNYWPTSLPKAVNYKGSWKASTDDYIADLDDENNVLTLGFNNSVSTSDLAIYIDDVDSTGAIMGDATKKMSWGTYSPGSTDYFWVKNFSGATFGSSTANEYFINWKIATSNSKDGEIWFFASSVTEAGNSVDTTSITNLIEGSDGSSSFGSIEYIFAGNSAQSANSVTSSFTYTVVETSDVRVVLRINERTPNNGGYSFDVTTEWTLYPTGQIFRWDSISSVSGGNPDDVYFDVCLDNSTSEVFKTARGNLQGVMYDASSLPDFATAFLTFKNNSETITSDTTPWLKDTMSTYNTTARSGISFQDQTTNNNTRWSDTPVELTTYIDLQYNTMDSLYMDSVSKSVQNINFEDNDLITGTRVTNSAGDADSDGFNEREGAYVIQASNNTINFLLEADGASDGCRFNPAIRVTSYSKSYKPRYVHLHNVGDTITLVDGYNYNSWLNEDGNELVIQLDTVLCVDTRIYLSADADLAVTLSDFYARAGDNRDTLFWETESESENLGYFIHRRIHPLFFIKLAQSVKNDYNTSSLENAAELYKTGVIRYTDTSWVCINSTIIPGAEGGTSVGPRKYSTVDYEVKNDVLYQYKLRSVSFDNTSEFHGPVEVMPEKQIIDKNIKIICAAPNPTLLRENNQIYFKYLGIVTADITLKIFDHLGNPLYKGQINSVNPGTVFKSWDLTNRRGRKVGNGVYIAVFKIDSPGNDSVLTKLMLGIRK